MSEVLPSYSGLQADGTQLDAPHVKESARARNACVAFETVTLPVMLRRLADACTDEVDLDISGQGVALQAFEKEVAALLGKPSALFFANDSMATIAAFRAHGAQRIVMHPASRFLHRGGLADAVVQRLSVPALASELLPHDIAGPAFIGEFSRDLTASDVLNHTWRTRECLYMELPHVLLGGSTMKWDDVQIISRCIRKAGAKCHLDGVRLLEIQPFYEMPLAELGAPFDSLTISFHESCGALGGSLLAGSEHFINEAKLWRSRLGGISTTFAPQWLDCRRCLMITSPGFSERLQQLRRIVCVLSSDPYFKGLIRFSPAIPQACFVHVYLRAEESLLQLAHENVFTRTGIYLWERLSGPGCGRRGESFFEWSMGPYNMGIPQEELVSAWRFLVEELCVVMQR